MLERKLVFRGKARPCVIALSHALAFVHFTAMGLAFQGSDLEVVKLLKYTTASNPFYATLQYICDLSVPLIYMFFLHQYIVIEPDLRSSSSRGSETACTRLLGVHLSLRHRLLSP